MIVARVVFTLYNPNLCLCDPYHQAREGQEIEITGLEPGIYYLTFDVDPEQHWLEIDDTNNRSWTKFRLDRKGANAKITILEEFGYEGNTRTNKRPVAVP